MQAASITSLTICGLNDLEYHSARGVTHVLSILDPDWPEPEAFWAYDPHHRTTLHFHDAIEPAPDIVLPEVDDVADVLAFGSDLARDASERREGHLLIHCHMGISRSTAAMTMLLAQAYPEAEEEAIIRRLVTIRPLAWPNLLMITFADELLQREGKLLTAVHRLHGRQIARKPYLADTMHRLGRGREVDQAIAPE